MELPAVRRTQSITLGRGKQQHRGPALGTREDCRAFCSRHAYTNKLFKFASEKSDRLYQANSLRVHYDL